MFIITKYCDVLHHAEIVSSPCRAVPSRTAPCVVTQQAAMTSHGITLVSEATPCKHSDLTQHSSHLARCCSDACTIEGFMRGTGMSKKSVFKKQLYERVVK
jgi:hypothetical protein